MEWKNEIPRDLASVPGAFAGFLSRINVCLRAVRALSAMRGEGALAVKIAEGNIVLDASKLATKEGVQQQYYDLGMPFRVTLTDVSNPAAPKATIQASSRLYKSISTADTQTITGLTSQITLASNTCVWIRVTVSSLAVTAASIQTGTAWPALVVTSGSPAAQTQFNVPIGRVVATAPTKPGFEFAISGTPYHFEQCLLGHLVVENRCNNGTPILYAFPWSGAA